jgi:hypothetical protein
MNTQKKRLIGVALVVVLALLTWQVVSLLKSDLGPKPVSTKQIARQAKPMNQKVPHKAQWQQTTVTSSTERQYLQLAADIQKAKMRYQLLQQQVAIAEAEKKLALSHQQTLNLSGSFSDGLNTQAKPADFLQSGTDLHLVYLAKVSHGHWEATVQKGSELMQVERGADLGNGGRVAAITSRGLWVQDAKGVSWLGFPGEPAPFTPPSSLEKVTQQSTPHQQLAIQKEVSVLNPTHSLSPDQLNVLKNRKTTEPVKRLALRKSRRLTSDEMLFLEQPAEGVTLLASLEDKDLYEFNALKQPVFFITVDGKQQLALGLYKTEGTARIQALALQEEIPNVQMTPISVDLLQQNILHHASKFV